MRLPPVLLPIWIAFSIPTYGADLIPAELTVEHRINPTGLQSKVPRLSWKLKAEKKGKSQTAYRILAASSEGKLRSNEGDLWDSGKKKSLSNYLVYYKSEKPLESGQAVYWKVQVWDENDEASPWSEAARFTVGVLGSDSWKAQWISFKNETPLHRDPSRLHLPAPRYYRTAFGTDKKVVRAQLYATALGVYEVHLNGSKVGDVYLAPGWSDYARRVYYQSYDVTSQILAGENCLGAIVADGWYAGYVGPAKRKRFGPFGTGRNLYGRTPALLVQLHLEFEDGTSRVVTTDPSWKVTTGPEFEADLLMGEGYDATRELTGWAKSGYDDEGWDQAVAAADNKPIRAFFQDRSGRRAAELQFVKPGGMGGYPAPPVRVVEQRKAVAVRESRPGCYLFDFGQNFTGNIRLQLAGQVVKKGQKITLRYGVDAKDLDVNRSRDANATDTYICKGAAEGERWTPRFTVHTFRFAEIEGLEARPGLDVLRGLVIHSDIALTSSFESSSERINQIFRNCVWTQRANWIDLPSSSEQMNERMGDLSMAQLFTKAACYHMDNSAFLRKWFREVSEARDKQGAFRRHAPFPFSEDRLPFGVGASDAGILAVFDYWWMYGDDEVVKRHWVAMKKYLNLRYESHRKGRGRPFGTAWGDRMHQNDLTPPKLIDLAMLALNYRLMGEMSRVAGNPIDHLTFSKTFVELQEEFRKSYVNADGSLKVKSQTAHVLTLRFGLLTQASRRQVTSDLLKLLREKESATNSGITTGAIGTKSLLPVLSFTGHQDVALKLVQSAKFPSWGYGIEQGATTLRSWGPGGKARVPQAPDLDLGYGAVSEWLLSMVAGIDTVFPGFRRLRLEPRIVEAQNGEPAEALSWVKAHYDSCRGRIAVHWHLREDGSLLYECSIPVQTTAMLRLPAKDGSRISVDGVALGNDRSFDGGSVQALGDGKITFNLTKSGSYRIEVK